MYVYLMASRKEGTFYLGVTRDLVRRVYQHKNKTTPGFTSRYAVDRLVWFETYDDPTTAISQEKEVKKWRRQWKIRLIEESNPDWRDLYEENCSLTFGRVAGFRARAFGAPRNDDVATSNPLALRLRSR